METVNDTLKRIMKDMETLKTRLEEGDTFVNPSHIAQISFYKRDSEAQQERIDKLKEFIDKECRRQHQSAHDWNCPGSYDDTKCGCGAREHNQKINSLLKDHYRTTESQRVRVSEIAETMRKNGLSEEFVSDAVEVANYYEGMYDLFEIWNNEEDVKERELTVKAIQEEIDEIKHWGNNEQTNEYQKTK